MLENKTRYVEQVGLGDHKLTIYTNNQERDIFASLFLQAALRRDDFVAIFTGKWHHFSRLIRKKSSFRAALKAGRLVLLDASKVYELDSPIDGFSQLFDELISESKKQDRRISFLGDCPPPAYLRYKLHYGIEEILDARDPELQQTTLCIYRNEGLASLDPADFLFIYHSHDSVLLNDTELQRSKKVR